MSSRSTVATSRAPWSSCTPLLTARPRPEQPRRLAKKRGGQHHEAVGGVDVVLYDLIVEHDDADQLDVDAQAGAGRWLVNRPRCMTSPTWTPSWRAALAFITASSARSWTRHPPVHDAEPILAEELAVGAA